MIWLATAGEVGDPEGERTVIAIVALLAVLGIALIMLAVWMWRVTRPDPELLAPLELMGERGWRRRDPVAQRRRLDEVRPHGAVPLSRPNAPPELDEAFHAGPRAFGVTDLRQFAISEPPPGARAQASRHDPGAAAAVAGVDRVPHSALEESADGPSPEPGPTGGEPHGPDPHIGAGGDRQ